MTEFHFQRPNAHTLAGAIRLHIYYTLQLFGGSHEQAAKALDVTPGWLQNYLSSPEDIGRRMTQQITEKSGEN